MKAQCTRFLSIFLVSSAAISGPASASEVPVTPQGSSLNSETSRTTWLDRLYAILQSVFEGMGGDPAIFNLETTAVGRIGLVADRYVKAGVPTHLSEPDLANFIDDVDTLYAMISDPPPGLALPTDNFMKILRLMWGDLGLPPAELGRSTPETLSN